MRLVKACTCLPKHWWIQGRNPRGRSPLLSFRPNLWPKGRKKFFGHRTPRLPQGLDDPGPPPYLKVWIRHYQRHFEFHEQIKHLQIQLAWLLVLVKVFWGGGGGGEVKKPRIQGFYELFYSHPFLASPPSQASVYLH